VPDLSYEDIDQLLVFMGTVMGQSVFIECGQFREYARLLDDIFRAVSSYWWGLAQGI
jgi:hypothetical protein